MSEPDIFVIGDVHGCASELKMLLNKLPLRPESILLFLGDYVDRGPQSKDVIDTILNLKDQGLNVVTLLGNHEKMFLDFLLGKHTPDSGSFIFNGGGATLSSYSVNEGEYAIPETHIEFLKGLLPFYETEKYFFVHAGVPDKPLSEIKLPQDLPVLLWTRETFYKSDFSWGKTIVHGHSPAREVYLSDSQINVDTGCVYDGKLSAIHLPDFHVYSVTKLQKFMPTYLRSSFPKRRGHRFDLPIPVYVEGQNELLQFETINFSEFGMLIKELRQESQSLLAGHPIAGHVGKDGSELIFFSGRVVWTERKNHHYEYGIEFLKPFPVNDIDPEHRLSKKK